VQLFFSFVQNGSDSLVVRQEDGMDVPLGCNIVVVMVNSAVLNGKKIGEYILGVTDLQPRQLFGCGCGYRGMYPTEPEAQKKKKEICKK